MDIGQQCDTQRGDKVKKFLIPLIVVLSAIAIAPSDPVDASHQPAIVVCEYFKIHTGDTTTWAYWDGGQRRYECGYRHYGYVGPINHTLCAYPPEHYSPPDNVWAKQSPCNIF